MSESGRKKAQQTLKLVQNDLEQLYMLLKQTAMPGKETLVEHMTGENGVLRPLGKLLNKLLEDPVLRQAMENNLPPDGKKH